MSKVTELPLPHGFCNHVEWAGIKDQINPRTQLVERKWMTITCDKVTDRGEEYCPHHYLLMLEEKPEQDRKMERARNGKARKKLWRDMLPDSPLAVPQKPNETGYQK